MTSNDDPKLVRVAEAISDGEPIDWKVLSLDARDGATVLRQFQAIERVADAHRHAARPDAAEHSQVSEPTDPRDERALSTWGPLRLLERIDVGSFSEIFRAFDSSLQREVALKLLLPERLTRGDEDRYLAEARRLASIRHANVLVVYGADRHDGRTGLWTELVRGRTLEGVLAAQGPFGPREATLVGMELCRALAAVHAAGLVHRDVKTSNVMREDGGRLVLLDFGAARDAASGRSAWDDAEGTPLAMAPEQLRGEPAGPQADLYALAVLLFRLVAGRYPIEATSLGELCERHASGAAVSILDVRPDVPPELARVIERGLAARPEDRFPSAGAMERALAGLLGAQGSGESTGGRPPGSKRRVIGFAVGAAAAAAVIWLALVNGPRLVARQATPPTQTAPPASPTSAGSAPTATLTAQASLHRNAGGLEQVLLPNDPISVGDALDLDIESAEPIHVYVLDQDQRGSMYVLFPIRELDLANPLAAGRHRLPGTLRGKRFNWEVSSAGGREDVVVIASRAPLPALEREIASFPRASSTEPLRYGQLSEPVTRGVRGIGRMVEHTDRVGRDGIDDALRALNENRGDRRDVWIWQIGLQGRKR